MPAGKLSFLRPLYDIAVWQFLIMSNLTRNELKKQDKSKRLSDGKPVLSLEMQIKIANIMCRLLTTTTFKHLLEHFDEKVDKVTGGWKPEEPATAKLAEWCQDQWRRKQPVLPRTEFTRSYLCMPLFSECVPLCVKCATPCPDCCQELGRNIPPELTALRDRASHDEDEGEKDSEQPPPKRMCLRSRK